MEEKWTEYDEIELERVKKLYWITFFLGWCGIHRFYQKKIGTGILYLLTFGLFLIGWFVDGFKIAIEWQKLIKKKDGDPKRKEEVLERAKNLDQKALYQNTFKGYKRCCPVCGGENYHAFVEEKVIRQGKTKSTVSLNLNPLKPFTVLNQKEKVVREPLTMQVSKFVCDDCGKIFS